MEHIWDEIACKFMSYLLNTICEQVRLIMTETKKIYIAKTHRNYELLYGDSDCGYTTFARSEVEYRSCNFLVCYLPPVYF